ncbi:branched-chain amino acid ABC transporter permease [Actinoplanes sp. NPDC051861]|uniref:branched-chain amino acid ABC transporter permease n=1 Tax=Actinoplanes sp. NPDC051861 TaxID=3155170 RepID=UPI00342B0A17
MTPGKTRLTAVLALACALLVPAGPALAFQADEWGFRGLLRDGAKQPVSGAVVEVRDDGDDVVGTDTTDAKGRWEVIPVDGPGTYTISIDTSDATGHFAGDTFEVDKELVESPSTLPVLNVVISTTESTQQVASFGDRFAQRAVSGFNLGLLIAIAAIGLSLVFGTSRFTNFAHGENVTFGGLMGFVLAYLAGLPLLVAAGIATVLGAAFGYAQDVTLWRPLRRRGVSLVTLMIASIGISLAIRSLYQFFFGNAARGMTAESWGTVTLGPVVLPATSYASMGISVVVLVAIGIWLKYGRIGKATRAISNNSALAATSGVDVDRVTRIVWTLSGALAALSGVLLGVFNQVSFDMGFNLLLLMFAGVILGGLGTAFGTLAGSIVVGVCTEILVLWIPADMKYVGGLAVLVAVLLVRPQGIFGRRERIG